MKKLLPYKFDNGFTSECYNFYRMSIVSAHPELTPWVMDHFYKIALYRSNFSSVNYLDVLGPEDQTYYDEVLEQREIADKSDILKTIADTINNDGYVFIRCDRFYIPGGEEYQVLHHHHPLMIYGYDDERRELYLTDAKLNGTAWKLHTYSFEIIEKAYYEGLKILKSDFNIPFGPGEITAGCTFHLKPFHRSLKLKFIYDNICILLKGGVLYSLNPENGQMEADMRIGISIYPYFYEDLYEGFLGGTINMQVETQPFGLLHSLEIFHLIKVNLWLRLKYLMDNHFIEYDETVLKKAEQLYNSIEFAKNSLIKFSYYNEKDIILKIRECFMQAEELERSILTRTKELLEKSLMESLEH